MVLRAVCAAGETDASHSSSHGSGHAGHAVFHHQTALAPDRHRARRVLEQVRVRLSPRYQCRREDAGIQQFEKVGFDKAQGELCRCGAGGHALPGFHGAKDLRRPVDGAEFRAIAFENRSLDVGSEGGGQRAAEVGFDSGVHGIGRHTREALHDLSRGDLVSGPRQGLRIGRAGDDFAVQENAVAVEDDQLGRFGFGRRHRAAILLSF